MIHELNFSLASVHFEEEEEAAGGHSMHMNVVVVRGHHLGLNRHSEGQKGSSNMFPIQAAECCTHHAEGLVNPKARGLYNKVRYRGSFCVSCDVKGVGLKKEIAALHRQCRCHLFLHNQ
jgi:hypothetical protein